MIAYAATQDLIPLYGIYALRFREAGLSTGQISALFLIWSVAGFVFEVPSGAWADLVDRRRLLIVSAAILAAAFSVWTAFPSFVGFAAGFALWGLSSAIQSGTFEAYLYDELVAHSRADRYAHIVGWASSASIGAVLVGMLAAGPLLELGGFALVGWVSVAVTLVHLALACYLPAPRRRNGAADPDAAEAADPEADAAGERYLARLRAGLIEAGRRGAVRGAVVVSALLVGLSAFDEYLPLLADEHGVAASSVPVVIALAVVAQMIGTALAGRTASMAPRTMRGVVAGAAATIALGAVLGGALGFGLLAVGYGALNNAMVVSEARLQSVIEGPARATVTSISGLAVEIVALATYGYFALGSAVTGTVTLVAALGVPLVGAAVAAGRWLPPSDGAQSVTRMNASVRASSRQAS